MSEMGEGTLVAPPVNLRVWVVASIAITGVEVAKATWKKHVKKWNSPHFYLVFYLVYYLSPLELLNVNQLLACFFCSE